MGARYVHTNLIARDWERLAAFYARVFECTAVGAARDLRGAWLDRATGLDGARLRGQHLRLPGTADVTLEIFQYDELAAAGESAANRPGFAHIAFAVDDVAATLAAVVDAGGSAHGDIVTAEVPGAGTLTFTYCRDPEGNLIELQRWT
jgi:predicted enzyme related to lactoylglutathione lyase